MGTDPLRPVGGPPERVWDALRRWWADADGPLVVRTSGSTGDPKDVLLARDALAASARASLDRLGGPSPWVLVLPVHTVAGLQVLVRSLLSGTEPVLDDASAAGLAAAPPGAGTSLVPTQLHRLDRAGGLPGLRHLGAVLVGGAALDPDLRDRARAAGVRLVETYGSSETCGGCVYDGVPLDGVRVRVAEDGRVELAGPVLFDGYAADPEATAAVLRDGWLRTDDRGRLADDGRLVVTGRADDVALSGGVAVHLLAVESAVRTHPAVADAVVVGVPDPEWGQRVVAVVVPEGRGPSPRQLRDHVARTLPRAWAPREVRAVRALPLLPGGKVDRRSLRRLSGPPAGSEEPATPE